MDRRRSLLKIAALRSEREQQMGVNCTKGYLQSQDAGLLFDGPRTLECFFKYIPSDKTQVIAGFGISMIEIQTLTTNQLRVYCGGGNATVDIVPGDSYLVDVAYDGTTAIYYLNGTEVARFPVTGYKITDLFRTGSNTYIPQGSLVFCRHYNYAISAEEAAAHYNNGDPMGYVVPKLYRQFGPEVTPKLETYEFNIGDEYYRSVISEVKYPFDCIYRVDYVVNEWDYQPKSYGSVGFLGIIGATILTTDSQDWSTLEKAKVGEPRNLLVKMPGAGNPALYVYGGNDNEVATARHLKVTIKGITPVGLIAEYLPQSLVGSPHGDPVEIIGENSYTWSGVDDPAYSHVVRCSRYFKISEVYKMRVTISDYEAGGAPFFKISTADTVILSGFNGDGTYELYLQVKGTPYQFVYVYAGSTGTDRRITITVDSIEPVPGVATSWLDSAKQLPLNDEYLPPLLQSDGGYDLAANGTPQIIIK